MTIASEITRIEGNISAAYTAADAKGATMPATENSDNLATCIATIPSGGGSGVGIPREVVNGVYQFPLSNFTYSLPSNITDIGENALIQAFNKCTSLIGVDLSSVTTISGDSALYFTFNKCTNLTSVDLSSLTTVSGRIALSNAFEGCTNLVSVDLSSLTTVSGSTALSNAFKDCTNLVGIDLSSLTTISGQGALTYSFRDCAQLTSVNLSSLTTISGSRALMYAFYGCIRLSSLSFPALTSTSFGSDTNQFKGMLNGVPGCSVHFPSNLQSVIGSWTDVTTGFEGTNTTVLFDLPATS